VAHELTVDNVHPTNTSINHYRLETAVSKELFLLHVQESAIEKKQIIEYNSYYKNHERQHSLVWIFHDEELKSR
jgi:hypothetical protein